jgi:hypothetical protein
LNGLLTWYVLYLQGYTNLILNKTAKAIPKKIPLVQIQNYKFFEKIVSGWVDEWNKIYVLLTRSIVCFNRLRPA